MREIKFRAWDVESPAMLSWVEVQQQWIDEGYHPAILDNDHYVCMQYTGLKDKNGVEIYRHDVADLTGSGKHLVVIDYCTRRGSFVSVAIDKFKQDGSYDLDETSDHLYGAEFITVIGNIYETPELLNQ